eukprot:g1656.t1
MDEGEGYVMERQASDDALMTAGGYTTHTYEEAQAGRGNKRLSQEEMMAFSEQERAKELAAFRASLGSAVVAVAAYMTLNHVGAPQQWTIIDSCYWSITTITTVGYGDLTPDTFLARWYTLFSAPIGVVIVGVSVHRLAQSIMRVKEKVYHDAQLVVERTALKALRAASKNARDFSESRLFDGQCSPIRFVCNVIGVLAQLVGYLCLGALALVEIEKGSQQLSFFEAVYCWVITLSSVGFGDFSPQTQQGRLFAVFYIPFGIIILTNAVSTTAHEYTLCFSHHPRQQKMDRRALVKALEWYGDDGVVSEAEFMSAMLQIKHGVPRAVLEHIHTKFAQWDEKDPTCARGVPVKTLRKALQEEDASGREREQGEGEAQQHNADESASTAEQLSKTDRIVAHMVRLASDRTEGDEDGGSSGSGQSAAVDLAGRKIAV